MNDIKNPTTKKPTKTYTDAELELPLMRHRGKTKPAKYILDPSLNPWDMQPFDTCKSYRAFEIYLALGAERSLSKVTSLIATKSNNNNDDSTLNQSFSELSEFTEQLCLPKEKKTGKLIKKSSKTGIERQSAQAVARPVASWSTDHLWPARVRAWDQHLATLRRQQQESDVEHMNKLHSTRFARLQDIAEDKIERLARSPMLPSWRDAISMLVEGAKGERLARGVGADRPAVGVNISQEFNLQGLSKNELEQFIELHGKISATSAPIIIENGQDSRISEEYDDDEPSDQSE